MIKFPPCPRCNGQLDKQDDGRWFCFIGCSGYFTETIDGFKEDPTRRYKGELHGAMFSDNRVRSNAVH